MILLEAKSLTVQLDGYRRLDDFSLVLQSGQVITLLGTNGAGKSTALSVLAGALPASAGEVCLSLELQGDFSPIGYLPQKNPFYPYRSVDENLRFAALLQRIPNHQIQEAVERVKSHLFLEEVSSWLAYQLSEGMAQRLGLAMTLIHQPKILLLDEPSVGLDPIQADNLREILQELKQHCGIIISTHLQADVEGLADQVVMLHQGKTRMNKVVDDDFVYADVVAFLREISQQEKT